MTTIDNKEEEEEEVRWIESEFLQEEHNNRIISNNADDDNNHHNDDCDSNSNDDDNYDNGDGLLLTDMFSDPDPYDTFQFSFSRNTTTDDNNHNTKETSKNDDNDICITLQGYKAENGQLLNSTGLTIWRASHLLCDYLLQHPSCVQNKRVLELGAGLGLCGILAHHLEANPIVITDGDTDTLANLRSNVEQNGRGGTTNTSTNSYDDNDANNKKNNKIDNDKRNRAGTTVYCQQLVWGNNHDIKRILKHIINNNNNNNNNSNPSETTNTNSDHSTLPILKRSTKQQQQHDDYSNTNYFQTILGSDIIYVEEILEPLWNTVSQLLEPDGQFILAYARRNVSFDKVLTYATNFGFHWTVVPNTSEGVYIFERVRDKS